jgi:hypothetical protein
MTTTLTNNTLAIAQLKKILGKKLFAIALKTPSSTSKKDVLEKVKACKGRKAMSQAAAVDGILNVASLIFTARRARNKARLGLNDYGHRITGTRYTGAPIFGGKTTLNHSGSLPTRLSRHKAAQLRNTITNFLPTLSGDVCGTVQFTEAFAEVGFRCGTSRGEQYSRKCTYHKTDGSWTVTAQAGWTITVAKAGLRSVDGMPTIAALPVETDVEGEQIFRAKWLEASRGFSAHLREGFIIRRTIEGRTYTAHGTSIGAARSTITRQTPASIRAANEREAEKAARIESIKAKLADKLESGHLNGYADITVTMADSHAVGNCGSGTRNWIAKHLPGRTRATIKEIISVTDEHPRVLLACIHAIARQQQA